MPKDTTRMAISSDCHKTSIYCNDSANHLEYFKADIPLQYSYLTSFALASSPALATHSNWLPSLLWSYINPGVTAAGTYIPADVEHTPRSRGKTDAIPDSGKTAKIYFHHQGCYNPGDHTAVHWMAWQLSLWEKELSQKTVMFSAFIDNFKSVPARECPGISIVLRSPMPEWLTSCCGWCFILPSVSYKTFLSPRRPGDRTNMFVRTFNHVHGVWQEIPTVYDPETGSYSQLSHFCYVALFAKTDTPKNGTF